jgi:type VI secretion system secreted protein VgrG
MPTLELLLGGDSVLSVRRFSVQEALSSLFTVSVWACSDNPAVDLEAIIGKQASLRVASGQIFAKHGGARCWNGVVSAIEQVQAVQPALNNKELSTYYLRIVPTLWLLTQRRNYRLFQHMAIPDMVDRLLGEWGIHVTWKIDRSRYPKLELRVQYGESDYALLSRLLEEAGISFEYPDEGGEGTALLLHDAPAQDPARAGGPIRFVDNPNQASEKEFVTGVRLLHDMRPGALIVRDYDFRNPTFALHGDSLNAAGGEAKHEQYSYDPGAFLVEGGKPGHTPVADDKGVARHDQGFGHKLAGKALDAIRGDRRSVAFDTNVLDLWPGRIFSMDHHPHGELAESAKLLVTELALEGTPGGAWTIAGHAVFADAPYYPPRRTAKPRVEGVQSATVVGPPGQEIHTDEFGRVRLQFPWDREGKLDDHSSPWIRVGQGWAGTGYGMIVIPRVGQEVLVAFQEGDPDQPIVVGRVFNALQAVPYKLPEHKTRSTWKSNSSPGSGGFNEIMFEDRKGQELVWEHAQKNRRRLVKHDETITVGHDRQKLVKNDEHEKTLGYLKVYVGKDHDIVVKKDKRERVEGNSHLTVWGKRNQKVGGTHSLAVDGDRHEKVGKNHALAAGEEIHLAAGTSLVIEAARDLTLKGPGGFIRIDQSGVTIRGRMVRINSGGSAGRGKGASPEAPEEAVEAAVDDVSATLIGQ